MNMLQSDLYQNRWVRIRLTAGDKGVVFNNLLTHINKDSLCEAYKAIDGSKALGIDGVSKHNYGKQLETNLESLFERTHKGTYRPQAKREVLIPKADGKQRPLAIGWFEDKLVEWTVAKILGSVYEPVFIRNSFGFRSDKSAHQAIQATYKSLKGNKRPHVVEIDFARFFNTIPHRKMMKILGRRITDRRFKGLVGRLMQAAIQTADGLVEPTVVGSPQGSVASPVLANIYLNEMLKLWFIENYASYSVIIRYANDAVFLFRSEAKVKAKFRGHYNYFGYAMNWTKLNHFYYEAVRSLFKWLNRRSQKRSYNWEGFKERLEQFPLGKRRPQISYES